MHGDRELLPLTGLALLVKRTQNADCHQHTCPRVAKRSARFQGASVRLAGDRHNAAGCLTDHVEREVVAIGAVLGETFDLGIDDRRIDGFDRVIAETETLDDARGEVLDHHVRFGGEFLDDFVPFFQLQVAGDAFFIRVENEEIKGVGFTILRCGETPLVAALGVFDFDHLSAEPGQRFRTGGARLELRKIEHLDTRQCVFAVRRPTLPLSAMPSIYWRTKYESWV